MNFNYYSETDFKTVLFALVRIVFSGYLLINSVAEILHDKFLNQEPFTEPYQSGFSSTIATMAPFIFMVEFFLAGMMFIGIYTRISLQIMLGIFALHMVLFYSLGASEAVLSESYALVLAIVLLIFVRYNKFSLDYYNVWQTKMESQRLKDRIKERR